MSLDLKLFYLLNNLANKSPISDAIIVFFATYLPYFVVAIFILLLYFARYSKKQKFLILWTTILSAIIARLGITEIIRLFYHRPRPFISHQMHQLISENTWSFPSGHSAFFFALATAIYLSNRKWGISFFIAAIIINISRVIAGVHYPSDIIGGIIIGVSTVFLIFFLARKLKLPVWHWGSIFKKYNQPIYVSKYHLRLVWRH